jgi:lysophospholipase L1-like esterase
MTRKRVLLAAGAAIFLALGINATTAVWPISTVAEGTIAPTIPGAVVPGAMPTTFAVIGDSISTRASREGVDMSSGSWTTYASQLGAEFVAEGWAESGAKLLEMHANVTPITADVLVVLAGTNDLDGELTVDNRLWLVSDIVKKAGAERVILSAVPPLDRDPAASTEWKTLRTEQGTYVAGYTPDGMHPTAPAAVVAGEALRVAIVAVPSIDA